jgi:exosortase
MSEFATTNIPAAGTEGAVELRPLAFDFCRRWLPLALFSVLWLDLLRQLSYRWATNEQYTYGWFVPLLALGLFWRRWSTRPSAEAPRSEVNSQSPVVVTIFIFIVALLLLPVRVVHEINQDWPLFSWPLAMGVVLISLYAVFLFGGWRWVRHFVFPVCFTLAAVGWPYVIENSLTHGLMRLVVGLTVSILNPLDVMAFQRGSLIELSTGVVGVDEACSGIRSFQGTLMGALFMGELYLLRWPRRLGLILGGTVLAFFLNVMRTLFLTWHASGDGVEALKKWHDPAGLTVFLTSFGLLWAIAWLLRSRSDPPLSDRRPLSSDGKAARRFLIAIGCWFLCIIGLNELWYRVHEFKRIESAHWWVKFPTNLTTFNYSEIPDEARKLLKYDAGTTASWQEPDGTQWQAFCFRWRAGDPTARMSALGHRPEYCLTGAGNELKAYLGTTFIPAAGFDLPFRAYVFNDSQQTLYVFFCLWEDDAEKQMGFGRSKYADRLRSVLRGRRGLGQQTLEIVVSGCKSISDAERVVRDRLPDLIRAESKLSSKELPSSRS